MNDQEQKPTDFASTNTDKTKLDALTDILDDKIEEIIESTLLHSAGGQFASQHRWYLDRDLSVKFAMGDCYVPSDAIFCTPAIPSTFDEITEAWPLGYQFRALDLSNKEIEQLNQALKEHAKEQEEEAINIPLDEDLEAFIESIEFPVTINDVIAICEIKNAAERVVKDIKSSVTLTEQFSEFSEIIIESFRTQEDRDRESWGCEVTCSRSTRDVAKALIEEGFEISEK